MPMSYEQQTIILYFVESKTVFYKIKIKNLNFFIKTFNFELAKVNNCFSWVMPFRC